MRVHTRRKVAGALSFALILTGWAAWAAPASAEPTPTPDPTTAGSSAEPSPNDQRSADPKKPTATLEASPSPSNSAGPSADAHDEPTSSTTPPGGPSASSSPSASPAAAPSGTPSGTPGKRAERDAAALADPSQVGVTKRNNLGARTLQPGQDFVYQITVRCSSLTTDCVNQTFTDVLPEGLDVTSLPGSTSTRTVTYDAATRQLSIAFRVPLQEPVGEVGLGAGDTVNLEVGMRLPAETPITSGTVITNTATTVADNAPQAEGVNRITVDVPRVVRPVTTKAWSDGSAVAGTDEASTITLGVRNASSTSAQVSSLTVTDAQPATFDNFNFTGATVATYPAGADTAQLLVCTVAGSACTDGDYQPGPTTSGTNLGLPPGVTAAQVTGVRVRFTADDGDPLPYDATGGSVRLGMVLRDTIRSTGAPLRPAGRLTVQNCAASTAVDAVQGSVTGAQACRGYDVLPDTLNLAAAKNYVADTDGNFAGGPGEYAVLGENSRVSGVVNIKNNSPFPIAEVVIREPGAGAGAGGNEFAKLDTDKVRLRYPAGATSAQLVISYADGTTATSTPANNATVSIAKTGTRVTGIEVTYRGVNAGGDATIAENSTAGLDLSGLLNDNVTDADLPAGTSPGLVNCAGFEGSAGRTDGTGTAVGNACATLDVRQRINTSTGVKTVGQTTVPPGQPIPFALRVVNNGTLPLVNPVISDPAAGNDGRPDPAAPNPFDQLRITSASIAQDPGTPNIIIEVFDPTADDWAPYDAANTALLTRATGIRARMLGNLTPTKAFTLNLVTQRRDGVPDGVSILNCFSTGASGEYTAGNPACAPRIQSGPVSQAASLNKSISPSVLPREVPGVPDQFADVILTVRNDGNLSMSTLQATDLDVDFFDQVDFTGFKPVQFPRGANRVRIDAYVNGAWVNGTPAAAPALPAGVAATEVRGIRGTFSSTNTDNSGYVITPCAQGDRSCEGKVIFTVSPRTTLRSLPGQTVAEVITDTVTGGFTTALSPDLDNPSPIPPVDATLTLTQGTPKLDVDKTPNSTIGPGETAPFNLTITNNGTANIPQLLVADALPAGFAFDDSFVGDNGLPFKIVNAQVPAGTDPVPTPAFQAITSGERISGLRFSFGDWVFRPGSTFQIQIQVGLEPGVITGQTITNTMGATSATPLPDLQCTAGDPVITDGIFGDGAGTFCTDTAAVTVRAGAAFSARKWVHGRDTLGWYNTRTRTRVTVGAAGCPATSDAEGVRYTAYPCIALVNPGDRYDYLLRVVNSGTEAAREMRIIDKFPVQGDRGVILDQARLTDWNNRPRLATEPVLNGTSPGTLANTYTNDSTVCAADLDLDPDEPKCAAGDWDDTFGLGNTGVQMRLTFPTRLAPGNGVALKFSMTTPDDVDQVADPTIAWNSFAHAETTVRAGGSDNYLPATEPIKTGVGLQYGTLGVTKAIGENPSNLPLADLQFGFSYRCTIDPIGGDQRVVAEGDLLATPGTTATVPGIPGGASCQVWETESFGGVSDAPQAEPKTVAIDPFVVGDTEPISSTTVTNDFPNAVITLRKNVTGAAAVHARDSYPVDVSCTFDGGPVDGFDPKRVDLEPGSVDFTVNVPTGATCAAVEVETGQATAVTYEPAAPPGVPGSGAVQALSGVASTITITNELRGGGLAIVKELTGPGAPDLADGPFTFDTSCQFDGRDIFTATTTLPGTDSAEDSPLRSKPFPTGPDGLYTLPVGAECTVTETDSGGADTTPDPVTVTILDEVDGEQQVATAALTNRFSAAVVSVTKTLAGDGADSPVARNATFQIRVTCQRKMGETTLTDLDKIITITGGQTLQVLGDRDNPAKLPLGSHCFGVETDPAGATAHSINYDSYDNAAVVEESDKLQELDLEATNTFDVARLRITKQVDGRAASFADGRTFQVAVTCVLPQGDQLTPVITDQLHSITGGGTVDIGELPVGARCWATEPDDGGSTSVKITADSADNAVVVGADDDATIGLTNTFDPGLLTVGKTVVNGAAGPYSFTVKCTVDGATINLGATGTFKLRDGENRTITVPYGAACTVDEVRNNNGAKVSFLDSDGDDNGVVIVNAAASVQVTNTFTEPSTGGGSSGNGNTGGSGSGSGGGGGSLDDTGSGGDLLSETGGPAGAVTAILTAIGLIAAGGYLLRRRRVGR